jgi:hypothetical protein
MYGIMTEEEQFQQLLLQNTANYGQYADLVTNGSMHVNSRNINDMNIDEHIKSVYNILLDGINLSSVQGYLIYVSFTDMQNVPVKYTIEDYFVQLIFWKLPTSIHEPLTSETMFLHGRITVNTICNYVNRIYIKKYIDNIKRSNLQMNEDMLMSMNLNINECFENFKLFIDFQMYLNNTLCLEDTLDLMNNYPEFYDAMHVDYSNVPLEELNDLGMEYTRKMIEIMCSPESNHCLKPMLNAGQCINDKQLKEMKANVGPKPNGMGNIIPAPITKPYLMNALGEIEPYVVDASASRVAQMLSHENVGKSGDFARILELNCQDTKLYPDARYKCNTKHTITRHIKDMKTLKLYNGRYYRFRKIFADNQNEQDKVINADTDTWLIGKTIEIYSPMTCASRSRGEGVCYRCYGDLAYTNFNINIGVIATELVSSGYTQRQLSAKHLLEAHVKTMSWNQSFDDILEVSFNTIKTYDSDEYSELYAKTNLIINTGDFDYEDEDDDIEYNSFVTCFYIEKDGVRTEYHTENGEYIYTSKDMNDIIASKLKSMKFYDGDAVDVSIPLYQLVDCDEIFLFHIDNDELSKAVNSAKALLNKKAETSKFTKDEILAEFCDINITGGFKVQSVHYEIIIAAQMRDGYDKLEYPDWTQVETSYQIVTLSKSLTENPSITTSLQYQKIGQMIWKPITYIKKKPAMNDLYFMTEPQEYIHSPGLISDSTNIKSDRENNIIEAVSFNKDLIGKGGFR